MRNSIRIEQADDNSFILDLTTVDEGGEGLKLKTSTKTAKSVSDLFTMLDSIIPTIFTKADAETFDEAFAESVESPEPTAPVPPKTTPKVIKSVDDTPLSEMTPVMFEKNKGKRVR